MIKSFSETSVFQFSESMSTHKISDIIKTISSEKNGTIYAIEDQMEDVFYKMRHKSFNFSAKFAVIDLFKKGVIKLIYNSHHKLTVGVPFFKFKMPAGGFGVIINITNYATLKPDGTFSMDPVILYTLMLSGAFSLIVDANSGHSINFELPELYGALFTNVIARITNVDQIKRSKIHFVSTKFFYMRLGVDEVRATAKAAANIRNMDKYLLEQTDMQFSVDSYSNLESFVEGIKKAFPEFSGFEFGILFDRWMRSYGESSAFAIEYIPFFYMVFIALITNSNSLVNVKAIEKEANKKDKKLITLFNKIESSVIDLSQR